MKISYAITVCNEVNEVRNLIDYLSKIKRPEDQIVVLFDKGNGIPEVWSYLQFCLKEYENVKVKAETFKNHFADWKNILTDMCDGDYIFQIDADEMPNEILIDNLPKILETNDVDVIMVPRINTVEGLTDEYIYKWRWNVNEKGYVNFPDYQWRVYKNDPKIRWKNKVHEVLEGHDSITNLPPEDHWCLRHDKKLDRQIKQNDYYDTL